MKKYIFIVTLATGMAFKCTGVGYTKDAALMDACRQLAEAGEYPEEEVEYIDLLKQEGDV